MQFKAIEGQTLVANRLTLSVDEGRVAHAQMLVGAPQATALAIAYAQYLCCTNRRHYEGDGQRADSCGECPSCRKFASLSHPDLGFVFPATKEGHDDVSPSQEHQADFVKFLEESHQCGTYDDWLSALNIEKKQAKIYVADANFIVDRLSLKSYEGGYKMMLIWLPEKMMNDAANKLLKTLEEPIGQTLILLVSADSSNLLPTVISRVQTINIGTGAEAEPSDETKALFVSWMRLLFKLNMRALSDTVDTMAAMSRDQLKRFLVYVLDQFQRSLMTHLAGDNQPLGTGDAKFDQSFPTMVTTNNAEAILNAINNTIYAIEQNAHAKIALMALSFTLSKHIKNR